MCQKLRTSRCAVVLFLLNSIFGTSDVFGQQPAAAELPEPEVLEQGPMHEAFARTLALDAGASMVTASRPPEPIEELPPEFQPEGNNVQWIPGYFMWQADREDFVWVSGLYRDIPPGRAWVPGAWQEAEGGFQWVPGFWSKGEQQELQFLPTPPDSMEQGPSSPTPGDNYLWAPGCWQWRNSGYAWQPGYWYEAHTNWVWVPSHYNYTPRGCLYVGGYWDYPFARRGLLYAPLYWGRDVHLHGSHYYRPRHVLSTALVVASLFVDNHHQYHFGYHGAGNHSAGLHRWGHDYGRHGGKGHHDPQWAHQQWSERHELHGGHADRQRGTGDRGPAGRDQHRLVTDVDRIDRQRHKEMNLHRTGKAEQLAQQKRAERIRQHSRQRAETKVTSHNPAAGTGQIRRRTELTRSKTRIAGNARGEKKTALGNQTQIREQGGRSRDTGQVRSEVGSSTAGKGQPDRRIRTDSQSAVVTKQREANRARLEAADRLRRSTSRGPQTVRRQSASTVPGITTQQRSSIPKRTTSQRRSPTYQGSSTFSNVAPGKVAPRSSSRTTRSPSPQRGRSSVQKSSRQTRSVAPSGGGQRSSRSYQRSSQGGGGKGGGGRSGGGKARGGKGGGDKSGKGRGH